MSNDIWSIPKITVEKVSNKPRKVNFLVVCLIIFFVVKGIGYYKNITSDSWREAYDNLLASLFSASNYYYILSDMNYDGIPELINFYYPERGGTKLQICTYQKNSSDIITLYEGYNVMPYNIGKKVEMFDISESDSTKVISCYMEKGKIKYSTKEIANKPKSVALIKYEQGDIISGKYKNKEADLSYLDIKPNEEKEYWDFDMNMAYQILTNEYTTEDVCGEIIAEVVHSKYYPGAVYQTIRFEAEILGLIGEMQYTDYLREGEQYSNDFDWVVYECIDEDVLVKKLNLVKVGKKDDVYYYHWNKKLDVKVCYYMNACRIWFRKYK